jgi:hypothetical protein
MVSIILHPSKLPPSGSSVTLVTLVTLGLDGVGNWRSIRKSQQKRDAPMKRISGTVKSQPTTNHTK